MVFREGSGVVLLQESGVLHGSGETTHGTDRLS
jgi:hypothetical protein